MESRVPSSALRCCCDFGCGQRRERRPRIPHPIDTHLTPIFGRTTVFSVPHAALAAGLFDPPTSSALSWGMLMAAIKVKWGRSSESFLRDAACAGVTMDRVRIAASGLPPGLIGWSRPASIKKSETPFGVCSDLVLTLAVLSHRAGNLILRSREPDFSWTRLFGGMYEVNERMEVAPTFYDKPWSIFQWKTDREASHECTI